jgi:N-alpha-acetyltransferase 15/16, NatA auxiliary subunit
MYKNNSIIFLASLFIKLGRLEEAERVYHILIDRNPDNAIYYKELEKCQKLDGKNDQEKIAALYESIILQRPKAPVPQLLQLTYLEGNAFDEKIRTYLIACFRKGIPSLFKNLVILYTNQRKVFS